jgi:mRNA interferase RelE/StbE
MSYQVEFSERAKKDLKKMDRFTQKMILSWIRKNLEGCENPRQHGKGLTFNHSGEWRYRVGDYRIIAEIQDRRVIILVLSVGRLSTIYD